MERSVKILYGSETGNAQDFAEQVWQKCRSRNIQAECFSVDDYPSIELIFEEHTLIFIISTSGQGEMPTNMRKNWSYLLLKKLPEKIWLSNTKFALLGLGDSSYQKYNYAAKKLYRRLVQLGSAPILDLALADEQHRLGIDQVFDKWLAELFEQDSIRALERRKQDEINPNKFHVDFKADDEPTTSKYFPLTLVESERVTSIEHFQETRLVTFSLEDADDDLSYSPGDILMVLPENLPESVLMAKDSLKLCQKHLNSPVFLCRVDSTVPKSPQFLRLVASPDATLSDCFHFYFDFQCIPKRAFIRQMAFRSQAGMERERLEELLSSDGIDDYLDYCVYAKRTLAEFLRDFPDTSAQLRPSDLFNFFPTIRPRAFSIASSPLAHPGKMQILVARVEYKIRRMKTPRYGLCSNFLCALEPNRKVFARIRPGIFHSNATEQLVLVGPGTGVAPFRSIISQNELASPARQILLFFSCRGEFRDFYFKEEWMRHSSTEVVTAFSRDQAEKVYVQHKIVENGKKVWEWIGGGAKLFIAGSSGEMPKQVIGALKEVMVSFGGITPQGADKYVEMMEKQRHIQFETWS